MYRFAQRLDGLSGSAIRELFALLQDPEIISFAGGNPSPESFPKQEIAQIAHELILERGDAVLQYGSTLGLPSFINAVCSKMESLSIPARPENVIITSGSTQGIGLAAKAFLNPGETVLVESPTFIGALQTFHTYQANLVELEMDENGAVPSDLEAKIKEHGAKLLYLIPTFQNPSGLTTPMGRRREIYDICKVHGVVIIEDDPYRELRYSGEEVAPLKTLDCDGGTVIYLFSASKTVSPGLRVGAAVASANIISKFNLCKQGEDLHTSNLSQAIVERYITSGDYAPHISKTRALYKAQRDAMAEGLASLLPDFSFKLPEGGLFIWCELPLGQNAKELFNQAVKRKVAFVPGVTSFAQNGRENTLRLNFSMCTPDKISEGLKRLSSVYGEYKK